MIPEQATRTRPDSGHLDVLRNGQERETTTTDASRSSLPELLAAWRAAERQWECRAPADDVRRSALAVVAAWAAYQDAALPAGGNEFLMVADDEGVYVGATSRVSSALGYEPYELMGRRIADIAAPELRAQAPGEWTRFLGAGRQDGGFWLQAKDGRLVAIRYQARAHHPVPGFHVSRMWPDDGPPALAEHG